MKEKPPMTKSDKYPTLGKGDLKPQTWDAVKGVLKEFSPLPPIFSDKFASMTASLWSISTNPDYSYMIRVAIMLAKRALYYCHPCLI